jgi:hypothetical protein
MLQGRQDLRQETKSTVLIQLDFYEEKGRLVKGFRNFLYGDSLVWELQNNLAHTFT